MSYQSHYFKEVREAQKNAYAPYSNFKVGAYL
ncbi:MAG: cytidine deaminase, partial [Staphylococcus epidermidis]|nr:cytidine deaminase [Staphylococcus epidermidis]MDU3213427.1 cytidine deaminase [Staphylococcus epidermidis]